MSKSRYIANKEWFQNHKIPYNILKFLYNILPAIMFIAVPVMIAVKAVLGFDGDLIKLICVPMGVLLAVSILRKIVNRPRPYEKYGTAPLLERKTKSKNKGGESFPSRHTASAFIIAMSGFVISVPLGIVLLCIAAVIGLTRILAGVHYISDVAAGMLISVIIGFIFFILF